MIMKMKFWAFTIVSLLFTLQGSLAEECGWQARGALCLGGLCCSQFGWCGNTTEYCTTRCQSQCSGGGGSEGDSDLPISEDISEAIFDELLKHRNDCPIQNFYTYDAFLTATEAFPDFGTTGDNDTRKREIAAFLAQTSHETAGGWSGAPDGQYAWGYCFITEQGGQFGYDYCAWDYPDYPCAPGRKYFGRGPIQLTWNYNYGECGEALGVDLLNYPDLVATDPVVSFSSALWFWMTPQPPKPSAHDVITGTWSPSRADWKADRSPGYGVITNIFNGALECGHGWNARSADRIGFYKRYCDILGVDYEDNLDCYNQKPFDEFGTLVDKI